MKEDNLVDENQTLSRKQVLASPLFKKSGFHKDKKRESKKVRGQSNRIILDDANYLQE